MCPKPLLKSYQKGPHLEPEPPDIRLLGLESKDILEAVEPWRETPPILKSWI